MSLSLSEKLKLFYTATSDLKAFQMLSKAQVLVSQTGMLFQQGEE